MVNAIITLVVALTVALLASSSIAWEGLRALNPDRSIRGRRILIFGIAAFVGWCGVLLTIVWKSGPAKLSEPLTVPAVIAMALIITLAVVAGSFSGLGYQRLMLRVVDRIKDDPAAAAGYARILGTSENNSKADPANQNGTTDSGTQERRE